MVKSCPNWHKTACEVQRIRCTTCFTSPETKETTPAGKGHACCLHLLMPCIVSKAEAAEKTRFLMVATAFTLIERQYGEEPWDSRSSENLQKTVDNSKANCCTLLKRITKLKCVNSEVNSVDIHPKQGCLNWPYGTMSESP